MTTDDIDTLLPRLIPYHDVLNEVELDDLTADLQTYKRNLTGLEDTGRNLRLAIVGQMKAGKSSLLNALFFGANILPKADTPMTAALTKIGYSNQPSAKVVFYSKDDWQAIEQDAQRYQQRYQQLKQSLLEEHAKTASPFTAKLSDSSLHRQIHEQLSQNLIAAQELIQQAKTLGLNPSEHLGKQLDLNAQSNEQLANTLLSYIGAQGQFTPITKMIEVFIHDPRLEGMDIIDTPGFNDPVLSRGKMTRDYLAQCDVILVLSTVSQFLSESDMRLIREQLSLSGIHETAVAVVGTQIDITFRQDANLVQQAGILAQNYPSEQQAAAKVAALRHLISDKMTKQFHSVLSAQLQQDKIDDKSKQILQSLMQSQLYFVASQNAIMAEHLHQLSADETYQQQQLQAAIGMTLTPELLKSMAGIDQIADLIQRQRQQKIELIANKTTALEQGLKQTVHNRLNKLLQSLQQRAELIRHGNIEQLNQQAKEVSERLNVGRAKLEDIFDEQLTTTKQSFAQLINESVADANNSTRVEMRTETKTIGIEVSTSSWYNPFSWGSSETRYETIVTHYADVQDAIEAVEQYVTNTRRNLQNEIMRSVNLPVLKSKISQAAMSLFDVGSASFDVQVLLAQVSKSLRKLTIPEVDFMQENYSQTIIQSFGHHRIDVSELGNLRDAQTEVIKKAMTDLNRTAHKKMEEITAGLTQAGESLVDNLIRDIQDDLAKLRSDIANKTKTLEKMDKAQATLNEMFAHD
jgi:hypothetical protein